MRENTTDHIIHIISDISDLVLFSNLGAFSVICSFLYICWCVHLFRDYRRSMRFARRIETQEFFSSESRVLALNLRFNAKRNKFFIAVLITELVASISYTLAFVYSICAKRYALLQSTGLHIGENCTNSSLIKHKIWIDELDYPLVGFLVNFARGMYLISIALTESLLKFIANTYVTESWQFKRMYNSVICAGIFSLFLVIFGTLPYTNVICNFPYLIAVIILLTLLSRRMSFLSNKALNWREQDMLFNTSGSLLRIQKKKKRRFRLLSRNLFCGLRILLTVEILVSVESVVSLFLYFGKCIFPILYNISYPPPIKGGPQLEILHISLAIFSIVEEFLVLLATYIIFLPYILYTIGSFVNAVWKRWHPRANSFHFTGNANSDIKKSLLTTE